MKKCELCGEEIVVGENYIQNEDDDCVHYDCCMNAGRKWLIKFLGYEIKTMEE